MAEIVLEDVWKVYADGTEAVRALDLDVADGEFVVLVGPSGCGKTTALRMIAGLEAITKGEVRIGIDTAVPNQLLKMPACDMRDPGAISAGMPLYMKLNPSTQFVSVELTYRDGSVSEIKSFRTASRSND